MGNLYKEKDAQFLSTLNNSVNAFFSKKNKSKDTKKGIFDGL